ncbi:MAG: superinfection immunity protein [bacterium]|nr:superinfection immunity protein [bacterium]
MENKNTKECPFCKKEIPIKAKKCKYCGNWLNEEIQPNATNDNSNNNNEILTNNKESSKTCPYCCQQIPTNAKKCQFCGEWVEKKPTKEPFGMCIVDVLNGIFGILAIIIGICIGVGTNSAGIGIAAIIIAFIVLYIYLLPTYIATDRKHPHTLAIFLVNLLFGETIIFWIVTLVWALSFSEDK